jgi:predicted O-methyltransferase YrrM
VADWDAAGRIEVREWRTDDPAFRAEVDELLVPAAGTEVVAPLLALLVRLIRPTTVLEIGMGYTTPFLAAALAELERQSKHESAALARKTRPYLAEAKDLDEEWLYADPSLLRPTFYRAAYRPRMVAVDNFSIPGSSAAGVRDVLARLGLLDRVTLLNADLLQCRELLPEDFSPIDLAWVDAWECLYFFDHFWDLINPAGGVVVMHYLMTYPEGEAILRYIAKFQRSRPGELEMINLLEPHKMLQNSLTVLRRTSAGPAPSYADPGGALRLGGALRDDASAQAALPPDDLDPGAS